MINIPVECSVSVLNYDKFRLAIQSMCKTLSVGIIWRGVSSDREPSSRIGADG